MSQGDLVILCNFGGPDRADAVEPFLRRLFLDPFIIRAPLPLWLRARLAARIARKRAPKAAAEYAQIGYSPINRMTEVQARHLEDMLAAYKPGTRVLVVNRYTPPYADDVIRAASLGELAGRRLFILTLYPHLCHSTTVSSLRDFDLACERVLGHRDLASTRVFSWWHTPRYLKHTAAQLEAGLEAALVQAGGSPVSILFSAHGIPTRYDLRGDPYVTEIKAHFAALKAAGERWLAGYEGGKHLGQMHWHLSFQSRVGPVEWVRPYTDETIKELGAKRGGHLLLVPISFTADHIETLYEMDHTYRELSERSGFKGYSRVRPSNDDPELAACLVDVLRAHGL